ncbi:Xaa-Pro aminopeptidase P [Carex littledalei]|uniref:Xaa-Pro aminopeptidase P n=1 Tax=Carex littledalei TaxID=544730 RepID=A0A833R5S5_9POAL|nr:Xaa-Pro aminopeptidase P [Carex littledalei]
MEATLSRPPLSFFLRRTPPLRRLFTLSLPPLLLASRRLRVSSCAQGSDGGRFVARPSSELRRGISETGANTSRGEDEKLISLRQIFSRPDVAIDAYIVPSQDAHQSEFIAECFMRRAYLTGFTGSAGTAVVTKDKAALWTDGRYFLQAEKELSTDWTLMRSGTVGVPTTTEWLNYILPPGARIGIDPFLFSFDAAEELKQEISKKNHNLILLKEFNLVDEIWKESRPEPPNKPTRVHDIKYAGADVASKLSYLRSQLSENGCTAIVVSMLDEVAWLLNMRGSDVPHSPVFYGYLVVGLDQATLFIDTRKVTKEVLTHLTSVGVQLKPYQSILAEVESLALKGAKLWLDTSSVNAAIVSVFRSACERYSTELNNNSSNQSIHYGGPDAVYKVSPVALAKAVKNNAEIEGMKNAHLRDAAALAEFWCWLEKETENNVALTEVDVADKLLEFRQKQDFFIETSFDTISGYGANGAIIHYSPTPEDCSLVESKNLFLLDSGGQYVDGTTDITRTGHIAIDEAVFPERTPGFVLDVLARSSLWKVGLDYRHGTGHGVGAALNVHEGPQSISFRFGNLTALQKGMVVSNEPGYYEDNSFGIRIENLLLVKEANVPNAYGGIEYLGFEKLTFVPIQTKLVELSLLSPGEIKWLNDYHAQVWEKVSPLLHGEALDWLWKNTRPILS